MATVAVGELNSVLAVVKEDFGFVAIETLPNYLAVADFGITAAKTTPAKFIYLAAIVKKNALVRTPGRALIPDYLAIRDFRVASTNTITIISKLDYLSPVIEENFFTITVIESIPDYLAVGNSGMGFSVVIIGELDNLVCIVKKNFPPGSDKAFSTSDPGYLPVGDSRPTIIVIVIGKHNGFFAVVKEDLGVVTIITCPNDLAIADFGILIVIAVVGELRDEPTGGTGFSTTQKNSQNSYK
jgi:hypothetical protein